MTRLHFAARVGAAGRLWSALLLASMLAQVFLPLQSHTRWAIDGDGRVVQLCTLEGVRTFHIDADGQVAEAQQEDAARSAAVAFSELLFHAAPVAAALSQPLAERHALPTPTGLQTAPTLPCQHLPAIRGPPVLLT